MKEVVLYIFMLFVIIEIYRELRDINAIILKTHCFFKCSKCINKLRCITTTNICKASKSFTCYHNYHKE